MKKLLMTICLMLSSMSMFAEQGEVWTGVNMNLGLNSNYQNFGVGAKIQYEFIKNLRGEASFNYFLKKDYHTMWDANLNVHYILRLGESKKLGVYPLAGVGLVDCTYEDTILQSAELNYHDVISGDIFSYRVICANAGAGIEYPITEWMKVNAEVKWQFPKDHDVRPVASIGFSFGL